MTRQEREAIWKSAGEVLDLPSLTVLAVAVRSLGSVHHDEIPVRVVLAARVLTVHPELLTDAVKALDKLEDGEAAK